MKEKRINVAELLKDCPKGMKINCLMYDGCTFKGITESKDNPIEIQTPDGTFVFTKYGSISGIKSAKCVIFPKGKTTWEGFVPPCKFNEGDVVISVHNDIHLLRTKDSSYCAFRERWNNKFDPSITTYVKVVRLATEEEKEKLFKAIKENGYTWNAETNTLEKLVEPKFKLGQNIRIKGESTTHIVTEVRENLYILDIKDISLPFADQNQWELVPNKPNKFDITTLKPFDKVLVRDEAEEEWRIEFFSHIENDEYMFVCHEYSWRQCVPYEGNEHLLNTTQDYADFYMTWK